MQFPILLGGAMNAFGKSSLPLPFQRLRIDRISGFAEAWPRPGAKADDGYRMVTMVTMCNMLGRSWKINEALAWESERVVVSARATVSDIRWYEYVASNCAILGCAMLIHAPQQFSSMISLLHAGMEGDVAMEIYPTLSSQQCSPSCMLCFRLAGKAVATGHK